MAPVRPICSFLSTLRSFRNGKNISYPSGSFARNRSTSSHSRERAWWPWNPTRNFFVIPAVFILAGATFSLPRSREVHAESPQEPGKRLIRLEEVHKHGRDAENVWVIKGDGVYDITDWIPNHPGGEVILRAAGGCIDAYWKIFAIHQKQDVYDILEQYKIGVVDPRDLIDGEVPHDHVDDPFSSDPERDSRLIVHSKRPCNAETPAAEMEDFITPNKIFYVRNHLWVPRHGEDAAKDYQLTIETYDGEEKKYTLQDLQEKFPEYTISAVLQCSGNRRAHMSANARTANGIQWNVGAIGNAEWTGVRLRDILADVGFPVGKALDTEARHVQFSGSEAYGASIPITKAADQYGDVILAYKMNGNPLPPDHGYPLRVIVPGHVAARSVKWVNKITLSDEESTSQWQRRDYKCFGPNQGPNPDWDSAPSIQEMPVQSALTSLKYISAHSSQSQRKWLQAYGLEEDSVLLSGYAFSGGGREIVRVDISADDGRSWQQAELLPSDAKGSRAWSWKRWRCILPNSQVGKVFVIKAVDEAYNTQPDGYEAHFNFRGNLTSGWMRVENKPVKEVSE
ncbi:hypothetical protein K402DRAFT_390794 [Aulographum hederae CBS 113979]|uniref:Nitrate reductase [NADPH] n=1 Tax=Aulographum hederae CBS 113979 TaxID=1176131 RepID=A0A6G1H9E0_9PEZI|nr:hypothetical protein K402DRAFT_390794 [Aulographum hederae CBS 113979]